MNIEERIAALEVEVTALRQQVTDTHTLAAHADRDVAEFREELRAQTRLLNINRQDMTVLRQGMAELVETSTQRHAEVKGGLAHIATILQGLTS